MEILLASYGLSKPPSDDGPRNNSGQTSCSTGDREKLEKQLRSQAEARVDEELQGADWLTVRAQWRIILEREEGLRGSALDAEVALRERVHRNKAVDAEVRRRRAVEVDAACDELANREAVTPLFEMSQAERHFLSLHLRQLRMSSVDRVGAMFKFVMNIYRKMSGMLKILLLCSCVFCFLLFLPNIVFMIMEMFSNPVARAKVTLTLFFTIGVLILARSLGI